jgi:alanyl-tRNA synthetase
MSEQQEIQEQTPIQPAVDLEALMAENAAMKAKMDELLTEAKKAKSAKREIEEQSQIERERIAREKGDFEQLHRSSEERYQATVKELDSMRASVANEKRNNAAMKVATELAEGANAELLSEFISRRLKYHDDGVKVTDSSGDLTVSTLDDLKAEFKNDARYSALLKGNQSSGGGASGGSNSGGAAKVKSRAEFEALDPAGRMSFVKSGGKLTDN